MAQTPRPDPKTDPTTGPKSGRATDRAKGLTLPTEVGAAETPRLTDRFALLRQRARAAGRPEGPALFLQEVTADGIQERLEEVNKTFTAPAIVSGWPEVWRPRLPTARLVPDAPTLALDEGAHDLVIHALSLHWAEDPVGQLVQCRRALRPDGLLIATLFGGQTLAPLRSALAEAEVRARGGLSPRILPMGDIRDLGGLLGRAGLALTVADSETLRVSYPDPLSLMRDLRAMGEGNAMAARERGLARRDVLLAGAARLTQVAGGPDGRLTIPFEVVTLTGWAPAADQPRPLRPGSATTRLADALNTDETPLPGPGPTSGN